MRKRGAAWLLTIAIFALGEMPYVAKRSCAIYVELEQQIY